MVPDPSYKFQMICYDITEILMKVVLNTKKSNQLFWRTKCPYIMHVQCNDCDSSRNNLYRDFSYMTDIMGQHMPLNARKNKVTPIHKI